MRKPYSLVVIAIMMTQMVMAQVLFNEASNRNFTQIADSDGEYPDWIELYNAGPSSVNLNGYHLSDDTSRLSQWTFSNITLPSHQWLLVFASGKNIMGNGIHHWETAVNDNDTWRWINPTAATSANWPNANFNDASWAQGQGGFGFSDNDDVTTFPASNIAVYTRIAFNVSDPSKIVAAVLHADYDDGFVAYLNGVEITRSNMSGPTSWNTPADGGHEALMYQGQNPEEFQLDMAQISSLLVTGTNVLAMEGHNVNGSSDMTLRGFLSFGMADANTQFGSTPSWFNLQTNAGLHTNFKLSGDGETLFLTDAAGTLLDRLVVPATLPLDHSIGSTTDGAATRGVFVNATPNASNNSQTAYSNGYESAPVISQAAGFYSGAVTLTITSSSPTAQIRYTIDGQTPTASSPLYTSALTIGSSRVLKARCFSTANKLPSATVTNSYFINETATQAGVLCLTTDDANLYGSTGIYDNWTTDWKRPVYMEYFEPGSHALVFEQNAGIKIDGGAGGSRSQPQRSFRVEPGNNLFGDGDLQYPLIPTTDRTSYETFYLRNGSNQHLYYPCKDAIETACMAAETKNTYSGYTPVQVYLNGQYWGYYELREKQDADYYKQHFGTDKDSLELLSVSYWYGGALRAVDGVDPIGHFNDDYNNQFLSLNTNSPTYWNDVDQLFDLEYYTDYICAQSWIGNTDWPYNNIKIYQSPETGHRWRFGTIDLEWSLSPNGWQNSSFDHINFMNNYGTGYPYLHIWQKSMLNNQFHDYFINRFADLMNTAWMPQTLQQRADDIYNITRPEMPATFARWADPNNVAGYMAAFDDAHQQMLSELGARSANVRQHIQSNYNLPQQVLTTLNVLPAGAGKIQISTVKPDTYPWSGIYFDGVPVKIEAIANPGYTFSHWDANGLLSQLNNAVYLDTLTQSAIFTAHFNVGTSSSQVTIAEVNYNSEASIDAGDWVEFWNYNTSLAADLTGWYFTDSDPTHVYTFPANTSIPANGRIVVVQDDVLFSAQHPGVAHLSAFAFGLGGGGDAVRLYDNNSNLVAEVVYADTMPWPLGADGQGRTLEQISPNTPIGNASNWFDGCIGGSPGQPYSPCSEPIVFSEINYSSGLTYDAGDWVELRNLSSAPVNISGWTFKDGIDSIGHDFVIPAGTILNSHKNFVVAQDQTKFTTIHPSVTNYAASFVFGLSSNGEWIRAYDATGKLRVSVRYDNNSPWPTSPNGGGYTLEMQDSTGQMNNGNNWFAGCLGGSPGRFYSQPCYPVGLNPALLPLAASVSPNPTDGNLTIALHESGTTRATLYDFTGKVLSYSEHTGTSFDLDLHDYQAGFYLLMLQNEQGAQASFKVVKE